MKRRILALILGLMVLVTGLTGCRSIQQLLEVDEDFSIHSIEPRFRDSQANGRTDADLAAMAPERYAGEAEFNALAEEMEAATRRRNAIGTIRESYDRLYDEVSHVATLTNLSMIHFNGSMDDGELGEIYAHNSAAAQRMVQRFTEACVTVIRSDYGSQFQEHVGRDVAEALEQEAQQGGELSENAEAIEACNARIQELNRRYSAFPMEGVAVEYRGRSYNLALDSGAMEGLPEEEQAELAELYARAALEKLGGIYVELVGEYRELARLQGASSAADYFYRVMHARSYGPGEMEPFLDSVKTHMGPVVEKLDPYRSMNTCRTMTREEVYGAMETFIPMVSEEMEAIYDDGRAHNAFFLYPAAANVKDASFTSVLSSLSRPVIYHSEEGSFNDAGILIHEFGHFCDMTISHTGSIFGDSTDLDLAEVISTSLEMLFYLKYDEILGDEAWGEKLTCLTRNGIGVVENCMSEVAQLRIFEEEELTVDRVCEIFREVALEFGFSEEYARSFSLGWVGIPHLYQSPFYMISYSLSAAAAFEVLHVGLEEGFDAAVGLYLQLLSLGSTDFAYREALELCSMECLTAEGMARIARTVLEQVDLVLDGLN